MALRLRVGGVPEHFNAPWHLAKQKGAFLAAGIELEYVDYPGGTGAMTKALGDNSLDAAVLLTEGCVKDIATGGGHKIVAVYVHSSLCWGVHTGAAQSAIQSMSDLDGKVWAVSRMTSGSHLMAVVLAKQQGWDHTQLQYEIVNHLQGAQEALTAGTSNGFLWEKFTTKPLVDSGVFRRVGEVPTPWPCFVITVRNDVLVQHGEKIKDLLAVIQGECKAFKADPDAPTYIAKTYGQKPEDAAEWFSTVEWNYGTPMDPTMLQLVGDTLVDLRVIEKTPPSEDLVWGL